MDFDNTIDNAKWKDYGWENNIFYLSFGDFTDTDGDIFSFLIEYRKENDAFIFFMQYEDAEIEYDCGNEQVNAFFENHMNKELMQSTIEHMKKLMKQADNSMILNCKYCRSGQKDIVGRKCQGCINRNKFELI